MHQDCGTQAHPTGLNSFRAWSSCVAVVSRRKKAISLGVGDDVYERVSVTINGEVKPPVLCNSCLPEVAGFVVLLCRCKRAAFRQRVLISFGASRCRAGS